MNEEPRTLASGAAPPGTSTSTFDVNLADWDAATEMVFPPDFQLGEMKEREYYEKIINSFLHTRR